MKICIWMTKLFELGGTKRVVTLLSNELVKKHDVTIMIHQDPLTEDRNMYHMSKDIKVDFIKLSDFVDKRKTPAFVLRFIIKKLNKTLGMFNRSCFDQFLADAYFPGKTRERWINYLNRQDYDIIIATAALSLELAVLAPGLKAKTIGWQHSCFDGYLYKPNALFRNQESLLKRYLPGLDRYIVLSEYDKRDYKEKLGISTEVRTNPRSFVSKKKCDPSRKRFLMVGRLAYVKGLDLLLDSFGEFCREDSEWQLDIVGDGELGDELCALAAEKGLTDRVNFAGYTNEPEKYYLNSSVFLLPSRWEGWPMAVMEAYEFGLPVIAYRTAAMDLIVEDGVTGYLAEAFDTHGFAAAMKRMASDRELRYRMHCNVIEKSEDFAIEKTVKEWEQLFDEVVNGGEKCPVS